MNKKISILFIAILLSVVSCKSNTFYSKVVFSLENKIFIISDEKKEIRIDFNNNVDKIINDYKAVHCLSGGGFDLYTIKPYPIEFAKIYEEGKDKALDIIIMNDIKKGIRAVDDKLSKYTKQYKDILFKIKYDNYYLEINNKMTIDNVIDQLHKNKMEFFFKSDERLSIEDSRINILFDKESKAIYFIQYFFDKREKPIEQKIVN